VKKTFVFSSVLLACTRSAPSPAPAPVPPQASASASASASIDADPPGTYLGRVLAKPIGPAGIGWLDREGRDLVQKPDHVLDDVLHVAPGQIVADVGCGSGYFTVHLAKRVGPSGKVYATDAQKEMLAALEKKIIARRLTNVVPILAAEDDARLPKATFDLVLMVDVYHELQEPAATLAQLRAALKPSGHLALVEYRGEDSKLEIRPEHKMTLDQIKKELGANGFTFVASDESLPEQHIVTFTAR
jgi:predicted methyltransferase